MLTINTPEYGKIFATADTFDGLRSLSATACRDGYWALVGGASSIRDGLGGLFVWDDHSTAADDDETVIRPTGSSGAGRWVGIAVGRTGADGVQGPQGPISTVPGPSGSGPNSIASYGSISNEASAANALATAFLAAQPGGVLYSPTPFSIGAADPINPGVELIGRGVFRRDLRLSSMGVPAGQRPIQKIGRDHSQMSWGHEYLIPAFLHYFRVGHPVKIALIGDSNTEGYAGPYLAEMFASFPNTTVQNFGVSGSTFEHFCTNSGPVAGTNKSLNDVLAFAPDLLIDLYGGTNDAYYDSGTPATFYESKRLGYQTIRAHAHGSIDQMAIVMVTAGPMSDGGSGRDERFNFEVRPHIIALAEEFQCAFSDKNGRVPDAVVDLTGPHSNIILDAPRVHTQEVLSKMLARWVFEDIIPSAYRPGGYTLLDGQVLAEGLSAAKYPQGVSMGRVTTADFPANGFVVTVRPESTAGAFPLQFNYGVGDGALHFRAGLTGGAGWSAWRELGTSTSGGGGSTAPVIDNVTPATGLSLPATEQMASNIGGSTVQMQGYLLVDTPAPLTPAQVIASVSAAACPQFDQWLVDLVIWDGTNWEKVRGRIAPTGEITAQSASAISAVRVYLYAAWPKFH